MLEMNEKYAQEKRNVSKSNNKQLFQQHKLLCLIYPIYPTLCQPFRGHFRFFNMKPSCLSGLWTLLWPIFSPSIISQLSVSWRGRRIHICVNANPLTPPAEDGNHTWCHVVLFVMKTISTCVSLAFILSIAHKKFKKNTTLQKFLLLTQHFHSISFLLTVLFPLLAGL